MIGTWKQMDALARQLYLESVSFDELQILAKNKEKLSTAIPATWPIDRNKLRNGIGAFGMRRHPIYGRYILHKASTWRATWATPSTPRATAWSKKST